MSLGLILLVLVVSLTAAAFRLDAKVHGCGRRVDLAFTLVTACGACVACAVLGVYRGRRSWSGVCRR